MADENGSGESSAITPLADVFSNDPTPEVEKTSSADEKDTETDDKDEGDQKFPVSESSPSEEIKKDDKGEKPEKPALDAKKETPEVAVDAEKKEEKPSQDEKALKEKWENEENPYFKRYRDTSANWNKEHQEKLQLQGQISQMQQEMVTMRKIADGTYDPEKDDPARQIKPEHVAAQALEVGKAVASRDAAVQQYGVEKVESQLAEFHQLFGQNSLIQHLVLNADAPVYEAFRILERYKFESKYGSNPVDIEKNLRAAVEKELRAQIKKEITDELMGREDKKSNTPRGLSSSRGSNGLRSGQNPKGKGPTPLKDLF